MQLLKQKLGFIVNITQQPGDVGLLSQQPNLLGVQMALFLGSFLLQVHSVNSSVTLDKDISNPSEQIYLNIEFRKRTFLIISSPSHQILWSSFVFYQSLRCADFHFKSLSEFHIPLPLISVNVFRPMSTFTVHFLTLCPFPGHQSGFSCLQCQYHYSNVYFLALYLSLHWPLTAHTSFRQGSCSHVATECIYGVLNTCTERGKPKGLKRKLIVWWNIFFLFYS